jgi:hypothetical protein
MVGGVMTTGQANNKGRQHKRHQTRLTDRRKCYHRQEFARLAPGAADHLRPPKIATGSLGSASPPIDG